MSLTPDQEVQVAAALAAARTAAEARLASLTADHAEIVEAQQWSPNDDEHDPEGSTIAVAREQLSALMAQARGELASLDEAERALAGGRLGRCSVCGGPIGFERLIALPGTTTCVTCA